VTDNSCIDRFAPPLGEFDVIASPLDPPPPLCTSLSIPLFQTGQRREGGLGGGKLVQLPLHQKLDGSSPLRTVDMGCSTMFCPFTGKRERRVIDATEEPSSVLRNDFKINLPEGCSFVLPRLLTGP
jgi:hypothetical protein